PAWTSQHTRAHTDTDGGGRDGPSGPRKEKGPLGEPDPPSGPVSRRQKNGEEGDRRLYPIAIHLWHLVSNQHAGGVVIFKCGFYSSASLHMRLRVPCVRGSYGAW